MARLPEALDQAIANLADQPDTSYLEAMHQLGITTHEAEALATEVTHRTDTKHQAAMIGIHTGILIGKGLATQTGGGG